MPALQIIHDLPASITHITHDGESPLPAGYLWSGQHAIPPIGERVMVTMNGLGAGTVTAYTISCDQWVGVKVKLDAPPAWYAKQCARYGADPSDSCVVYGTEIKPIGVCQ